MSRPRPRPPATGADARRRTSGTSIGPETSSATQEGPESAPASVPGSQPSASSQRSSAHHRPFEASQAPIYRAPHQQQRGESRPARSTRRRGPVQEPPRHPAFQSPVPTPSSAGTHSDLPRRAQSPTHFARATVPLPYEPPPRPHFYVPSPTSVGYRPLHTPTGRPTAALASSPPSHAAALHSDLPTSPNQPLVTQTEEGFTYYTYGPFPNVPVYEHRAAVPTAVYGAPVRLQLEQASMGPYPTLPPAGPPSYPTGQATTASYSQGRPAPWPQLGPQPQASDHASRTSSGAMQQSTWRSGRRGTGHPLRPSSTAALPLSPAGDPSPSARQPVPSARFNRPLSQASRIFESSGDPSSEPMAPGEIASSDPASDQQSVATRSEHVMWVGNVPAGTTQEELQAFFTSRLSRGEGSAAPTDSTGGIVSIFIISRSNCAFVNFDSAHLLERAVHRFNGMTFRSQDRKTSRLVCRVRKREEEGQSGVAGQRGKHIHVAWLQEHNRRLRAEAAASGRAETSPTSRGADMPSDSSAVDVSSEEPPSESAISSDDSANLAGEGGSISSSSAEVSYASTNSDMLRHPAFRKRFFILKSLNVEELDHAVETGLWSTQPHNEKVLDQAFRTSEDVILIFSANQSGAFYGYAKMASPIPSKHRPGPATEEGQALSAESEPSQGLPRSAAASSSQGKASTVLFSDETVNASPEPLPSKRLFPASIEPSTGSDAGGEGTSTPTGPLESDPSQPPARQFTQSQPQIPALQEQSPRPFSTMSALGDGVVRRDMAFTGTLASSKEPNPADGGGDGVAAASVATSADPATSPPPGQSASADAEAEGHLLEASAMIHNMRLNQPEGDDSARVAADAGASRTAASEPDEPASRLSQRPESTGLTPQSEALGSRFAIQWLQTRPLPFTVVKRLRNAWNENRSIRVARDGTEVAIDTGLELCEVWERHVAAQ